MSVMKSCPSEEQLQQMLSTALAAGEQEAVMHHVEACRDCQQRLEHLTDFKPLALGLRHDSTARMITVSRDTAPSVDRGASLLSEPGGTGDEPLDTRRWPRIPEYQIVKELGRGGIAVVYLARHTRLSRHVALKLISADGQATPEQRLRFEVEGAIAARLQHPHIVQIHEMGVHDDQLYFALQYVPGGTLGEHLASRGISVRKAAVIVETVARAVHFAHQQGIVHRDLKPGNILLDDHQEPKISDFGLAKQLDVDLQLTRTGTVAGTPCYMPPEQAQGRVHAIGPATDVYSLGAILYEALTTTPPFRGATDVDTLHQVVHTEPTPPRQLNAHVPRDLETICLKCLEKDPALRYPTAEELASELRRFLQGEPIVARPLSPPARAVRWCKRHPLPTAIVALCLIALTLGSAMLTRQLALGRIAAAERQAKESAELLAAVRREQAYRTQIKLAEQAYKMGDLSLASTALDECPPDLRGWEWHLLDWRRPTSELTLKGHRRVFHLSYSANGSKLASAGDSTIRLWDARTGKPLWARQHEEATTVAIHPTQPVVVSSGHDGWLVVRSLETGEPLRRLEAEGQANWTMRMQPQGRLLAGGGDDGRIHLWDTTSWEQLPSPGGHLARIRGIDWSPDGNRLTSTSEGGQWKLFDLKAGTEEIIPLSYASSGESVAFHPSGIIVAQGNMDGGVTLWDIGARQPVQSPRPMTFRVSGLAFLTSTRLVSGGRDGSLVMPIESGQTLQMDGLTGEVYALAASPVEEKVAIGGLNGTIQIWGTTVPEQLVLPSRCGSIRCVAFHPTQPWLAVGGYDGSVQIWDYESGYEIRNLYGHEQMVTGTAFSGDGKLLASTSEAGVLRVSQVTDGTLLLKSPSYDGGGHVRFSPDSRLVAHPARAGAELVVLIWDVRANSIAKTLRGFDEPVSALAFSSNGTRMVTCDDLAAGQLRLWNLAEGTFQELGEEDWARGAVFSPDDKSILIAGQYESRVRRVRVDEAWTPKSTSLLQVNGRPNDVAISPDGKRIFAVTQSRELVVWDAATESLLLKLPAHDGSVWGVAISPDGATVATVGDDQTIRLWETKRPSPEVATARQFHAKVRSYVDEVFSEHVRMVDALAAVQGDATLDAPLRAAAVALVVARGDRPSRLREKSLQIASEATRAADEYREALSLIDAAREVMGDSPEYLAVRALILDRLEETAESELVLHKAHLLLAEPRWRSTSTREFVQRVEGMLHQ